MGSPPEPGEAGPVGRGGRNGALAEFSPRTAEMERAEFLPTKKGGPKRYLRFALRLSAPIIATKFHRHKGEITLQTYLSVTPEELRDAAGKYAGSFAHVAYRIGPGSTLLRRSMLLQTRGGLLSVSDRDAPPIDDPQALSAAVLRECGRRAFTGVLLDFEERPRRDRLAFVTRLDRALSAARRALFLPERYAQAAPSGVPLLCTAISGGSFSQYLQEAAARQGGAARLALDVQRLRMDFPLPAPSGEGEPLTEEAFRRLTERERPAVFFSQDLCARYFTYTRDGHTHFVLFDDADTLAQKLRMGGAMGFSAAFLMWPEVRDVAPRLFSRDRR